MSNPETATKKDCEWSLWLRNTSKNVLISAADSGLENLIPHFVYMCLTAIRTKTLKQEIRYPCSGQLTLNEEDSALSQAHR